MKTSAIVTLIVIVITTLLRAEPMGAVLPKSLPEPPANAPAGKKAKGAQIGLWSEKAAYSDNETPHLWSFARRDQDSPISIGVGGNLHKDSYLYVFNKKKQVAKTKLGGPSDGLCSSVIYYAGGCGFPKNLPKGVYTVVWMAATLESNTIEITIK